MTTEVDLLLEHARRESNIQIGVPATEEDIASFEKHYGVRFPSSVKEYFLKINGVP